MRRAFLAILHLGLGLALPAQTPAVRPPEATVEVIGYKTLAEAAAYQSPSLAGQASAIEAFQVKVGALQLDFQSGTATPILVGGNVRGLYLQGKGSFRYLAKDPVTQPLLRFNLKTNTQIVPEALASGALALGEPVKEAIVWFLGQKNLPTLPPPSLPTPTAAFQATREFFTPKEDVYTNGVPQQLNRMPIGELAAYQAANEPGKAVVTAELVGEKEHWVYTHDPVRGRLESLYIRRPKVTEGKIPTSDLIVVDYSPLGWTRKAPVDPDFRLAHIDLDLEASNKTFAKIKVVETLQVIRPGLRMLSFTLRDRNFSVGSLGQVKVLKSEVKRVLLNAQQDLPFIHQDGYLLVDLRRAAANGETLKLSFEVEGDLLGRYSSFDFWRLTPGEGWFPEPDMAGQSYTVKARIAVEKPFVAIASAKTISRSSNATHNLLEVSMDKPILWFSVAAGKYESSELVKNGRTVRAWSYGGVGKGAEPLLKTAHGVLEFYSQLLGNAPFDEVNLVEVPSLGFGQAPAGMIWLTREAFDAIGDELNRLVASKAAVGGWVNRLVSHEIAHQYWAHQVKMWSMEDQWITESFAEFTSALAMRAMKNKGPATFDIIVKDWQARAKLATKAASIPTANFLHPNEKGGDPETFRYRQDLVYSKGAFLLACLHKELGEPKFIQFLRQYQKSFPWYPPSFNQDVPDLLKTVTGKDYQAWMDRYFYGTEMPDWQP
jgi:hypothetical protein